MATAFGNANTEESDPGLLPALVGDGRALLALMAVGLIASGLFALFLSATVTFLPQDIAFLGMDPRTLCGLHQCRVVHFMFHDRVSFGGTLIAIGTLYLWILIDPLRKGEAWAWWTMLCSGSIGFLSFFCCLLYHYVDTWHATASVALLLLYVIGMAKTRMLLSLPREDWRSVFKPVTPLRWHTRAELGRVCLLFVGCGMVAAGLVIMFLGSTVVFVPQDVTYFGFTASQLNAINPRLIPLIAHDRAGFGGGLASCGMCVFLVLWKARQTRALWQGLLCAGLTGFGCAIGIHFPIGYRSLSHLAPAVAGAAIYLSGIVLLRPKGESENRKDAADAAPFLADF